MANHIHAISRDGKSFFRIWSTESDSYVTEELSKEAVSTWLRDEALRDFERDLSNRLKRACSTGSSSLIENRDTNSWEQERE